MEAKVLSTKSSLEEFKKSFIWKDFVRELSMLKRAFKKELLMFHEHAISNNLTSSTVLLHTGDLNGRIKAVEYFLTMPDIMIQIKIQEEENTSDT